MKDEPSERQSKYSLIEMIYFYKTVRLAKHTKGHPHDRAIERLREMIGRGTNDATQQDLILVGCGLLTMDEIRKEDI